MNALSAKAKLLNSDWIFGETPGHWLKFQGHLDFYWASLECVEGRLE